MTRGLRLLLCAAAAAALPASTQPAPELVGDVRIEAERGLAERLRRYVSVAKGQPLSPAAVRATVELLFATGELEDVTVDTLPAPGGVLVVFRPIPAPRLTSVRVRGDRVLSEKELRRASRLRSEERLWPARLEDAARDVAVELGRRGYLEARVDAAREQGPAGAAAVFQIHAGPLAKVAQVTVEGAPAETAEALRALARPRRGEAWRREPAQKAALAMQRELAARSRWRARVEAQELYDPKTARVSLRFLVEAGPRVSLAFRGTRLGAEQRRRAERKVRQGGARADALDEALDGIEQELHARGHRSPLLQHVETETPPDRLEIAIEVEAGEAAHVSSVRVLGVDEADFSAPHLETQPLLPLRDDALERDASALRRALHERGHANARVEAEAPEALREVPVVFRAFPGPRTHVEDVTLQAAGEQDVDVPLLATQAGELYRVRTVARDQEALLAAWQDAGYLHAEVRPKLEWSDDQKQVKVAFLVEPGARARVGAIVVAGLRETKSEVVRRELGIATGDAFSPSRLLEAQRRLQSLGIFERVSARALLGGADDLQPLVIEVQEASRTAVAYGFGYAERDLLHGNVDVTLRNLMGMDRSLNTFARVSFRGSRLLATYREPRLLGKKQELFVTGFREEQDRDSFDFLRRGGQLQSARSLSQRVTLIGRLTYQQTDLFNVTVPLDAIDRQFRSSTFAGPSGTLVYDSRDDPLDPKRGRFASADLGWSHALLGGDSFLKTFVQAASFTALSPRLVLAVQGRLGLGRTYNDEPPRLPLADRFFAGGDYSLRGFQTDFVGPLELGEDDELHPTGGNGLLLGSVELRLAAAPRLEIAGFSDVGNVYALASQIDLSNLRYSAGLGLRYKSSIGPIRVDYGYKLNRRPGEPPHRLHVTVGHAF